ncbi:MAG TPA: SDR family NAD(P)-dependent oxidoreductase [Pseudomonadales bacterium]|nr:SDR family NAD(P)-dependent oxidoreductase [Pseudomonadales bacterium]
MVSRFYPQAAGSVLITGTSTGIGYATTKRLAEAGFHVFAGVRKPEDGEKVAALEAAGCITPVIIDVADAASVTTAVEQVRNALIEKNGFLAGVISNAGVGMIAPTPYLNEEILHYQTQTNLLGHMRLARECLPLMQQTLQGRNRRGRIYFVGTGAGIPSLVFPFLNIYMACKWGTEAFCQSLRMEMKLLDAQIDVGMINPGFINTAMRGSTKNAVQGKVAMDAQFGQLYGRLMQKFGEFGDRQKGTPPEAAAEKILGMMMAVTPQYRYRVGRDSFTTYLQALLPLPVQEWLIARVYR